MAQERKVVTVLFCDLVGFTSRAEEMDPEDVAALLAPYHARLKQELERYGGTVEKFIGDAVMALFGAPTAHEDDPERAVRAAFAIRDFAQDQGIELRIGVTTGEALISLEARPERGETMAAGDVINTAARLQTSAPVNGVLVGEATFRATRTAIEYESREPVEAKGKSRPVPVWDALSPRARITLDRLHGASLVGRSHELALLEGALTRARQERSPQLVTLIGVPGIGKSRLVFELSQAVERDPELISWRQGRCLPYGDGVTFWALGEIVKAQAGILETDSAEQTEEKLKAAAEDPWMQTHLRPLVGLAAEQEVGTDRRGEAFAAWRGFLELLAEERPLVLVIEDLHWADEALLDFIDHLVEWAGGVPLLVVCTARPELLERRPGWGGGKPNALTLSLSPLSDDDTARLVGDLLKRPVLPAETQRALLARAGGNPLYAEQFARVLEERGELEGEWPLPETVQGLIAARLDLLAREEKALLQDAAVLGMVFWAGALSSLSSHEPGALEARLHALERKQFVRRERQSAVAGEDEYSFRHLLVRDVAYGQIPRGERAAKHQLAAEWIGTLGRPEDQAEMLAHHNLAALEFAGAAGQETVSIAERARIALRDAGDRALALDAFAAAARFYEQAVELWPPDDVERPLLLLAYGRALYPRDQGFEVLAEARDGLLASGDVDRAAEAEARLGHLVRLTGQMDEASLYFDRAAKLAEGRPASASIAFVLWTLSRASMTADENEKAIELGRRALAMAEALGLEQVRAGALNSIGAARVHRGDLEGVRDLERSIEIAEAASMGEVFRGYGNLGSLMSDLGDIRRARELVEKALESAQRFGHAVGIRFHRGNRVEMLFGGGEWEEALEECEGFLAEVEAGSPHFQEAGVRIVRAQIRLARADVAGALADVEVGLARARDVREPQLLHAVLAVAAFLFLEAGRREDAEKAVDELVAVGPHPAHFVTFAIVLTEFGRSADVVAAADGAALQTRWVDAARAYVEGDLVHAADLLDEIGDLPLEAYVRLRAAERFGAEGRREEAERQLERALAFYRSVGATRYLHQGETLLAAAG
ncbi:MAG: AAA family ATPase [Actinobacteria bacterium]|nr:AAA family ATPase [Actinomycetota bacterium]